MQFVVSSMNYRKSEDMQTMEIFSVSHIIRSNTKSIICRWALLDYLHTILIFINNFVYQRFSSQRLQSILVFLKQCAAVRAYLFVLKFVFHSNKITFDPHSHVRVCVCVRACVGLGLNIVVYLGATISFYSRHSEGTTNILLIFGISSDMVSMVNMGLQLFACTPLIGKSSKYPYFSTLEFG